MSEIILQPENRRIYIGGNSYPIKAAIKEAGGHWDADRKQWWIGTGKREAIEKAIANAKPEERKFDSGLDVKVRGQVRYKGRAYPYSFHGETKVGRSFKLHFRDGTKDFWAKEEECQILKQYREPLSLRRLNELAASYKAEQARPDDGPTKRCWECRGAFTYRYAKENQGDWNDSYCGC